ncbi:MAG: YicC/YloC family endoribonuclease, partial [Candidatus Bipolaricaulota bacterium]
MTGFGRAQATQGEHFIQVDLRTLNHRFLEVRVRGLVDLPLISQRCEDRLREAFARGSLELHVRWEGTGGRPKRLGLDAARRYLDDLAHLQEELGLDDRPTLAHLLTLGVFAEEAPEEEELWPALATALDGAIRAVAAARASEGETLRTALAREADLLRIAVVAAERLA